MKILVISAQYPPFHSGGYELRVKNIVDGLAERGHLLRVLTTKPRRQQKQTPAPLPYAVYRVLHNRYTARFFPKEVLFDLLDTKVLETHIQEFKPDVVYLGHTYTLSKALLPYLAGCSIPLVYDEGGNGLKGAWTERGRWFQFSGDYASRFRILNWLKPFVIKTVLKIGQGRIKPAWSWPKDMKVIINSQGNLDTLFEMGIPIRNAAVIHSGIDTQKFSFKPRPGIEKDLTIISPGRLEPRKGQLDAVQLIALLRQAGFNAKLILIGEKRSAGYYQNILQTIREFSVNDQVSIHPMVSQDELVAYYHQADICFFPSVQTTGFSRIPLEAMACGCIVIGYGFEGSDEIIINRENGFLVSEGDVNQVGKTILDLKDNPKLMKNIVISARSFIEKEHDLMSYIEKIEEIIFSIIEENKAKL